MTTNTLESFQFPMPSGSLQAKLLVVQGAIEQQKQNGQEQVRTLIQRTVSSNNISRAETIINLHNAQMREAQLANARYKFRYNLATGIAATVLTPSAPLLGVLSTTVAQTVGQEVFDIFTQHSLNKVKDDLALNLEILRQGTLNSNAVICSIKDQNGKDRGQKRMQIMQQHLNTFYDQAFDRVDGALKDTVISFKTKLLGDLNAQQFEQLLDHGKQLAQSSSNIQALTKRTLNNEKETHRIVDCFNQYVANTQKELGAIAEGFDLVHHTINGLDQAIQNNIRLIRANQGATAENFTRIRQNEQRLNFIEGFVYGQMDPQEQLNALESGFFKDLPEPEQTKLRDTAELKKILAVDIGKYTSGAASLIDTIDSLNSIIGDKIHIPEGIRKGVAVGCHLVDIGLSLLPPTTFSGAVSAVSKLIGMGRSNVDVGAARHSQVMNALGKLAQGQEEILKISTYVAQCMPVLLENQKRMFNKLLQIEEMLDRVINTQTKIIQFLSEIDKKIEQHFTTILTEFSKLTHEVALGHFNMYYGLHAPIIDLYQEAEKLLKTSQFDTTTNRFRSYTALSDFFRNQTKQSLKTGLPQLRKCMYITPKDESGTVFRLNNLQSTADWIPKYTGFYRTLWTMVSHLTPGADFAFFSGLFPSSTVDQLNSKLALAQTNTKDLLPKRFCDLFYTPSEFGNPTASLLLSEPYSFSVVKDFVTFAFRFHFLFDVCDGNSFELLPLEQLTKRKVASSEGQELLERALLRLEVLLAQQTLRSGDCFLPAFHEIWLKGGKDPNYQNLNSLFEQDTLLAHNFFMYALREEVTQRDPHYIRYTMARNSRGIVSELKALTQIKWHFEYIEARGWEVHFAKHVFSLPSTLQLKQGQLTQVEGLQTIYTLRQKILQELQGYRMAECIADAKTQDLYMAALYISG